MGTESLLCLSIQIVPGAYSSRVVIPQVVAEQMTGSIIKRVASKSSEIEDKFQTSRAFVERVLPQVDGGRYPSKRAVNDIVHVTANIHADGHNQLSAIVLYRQEGQSDWAFSRMDLQEPGWDLWAGDFEVTSLGVWEFTVEAWVDDFSNWRRDTRKKFDAGQDLSVEIKEGFSLISKAAKSATGAESEELKTFADIFSGPIDNHKLDTLLDDEQFLNLMFIYGERGKTTTYEPVLKVVVEPKRAVFGAWYEMFPRSASSDPHRHGNLRDVITQLPYIAGMGFDVLYLPPIHPIGTTARKGPNNTLVAGENDPGSPWAIGSAEGGHKAIHPQLGTMADFDDLVQTAAKYRIDIAIDIAFQCSPDHPYVKEYPEWFYHRPDGTIKCAENPPKRYEDIYPLNFECDQWENLWLELKEVILFWVEHGVKVFRVDNPHTKPYAFWEWVIAEIKKDHPETIFLAEAFARPMVMRHLAKIGFSQSYTYFTWRNSKQDLTEYFNELVHTDESQYLRPNLFANTPDILNEYLQTDHRSAFMIREALAATLGATYGIYGPVFELCVGEAQPAANGHSEEYKDSEKYQIRHWDLSSKNSIAQFIARLNKIRRTFTCLQTNDSLQFVPVDNDQLIAYVKSSEDKDEIILTVVNLDPNWTQSGFVTVPLTEFGLPGNYQAHDLVSNARYAWQGERNFVRLDPNVSPAHVFRLMPTPS
jgi:starch synthase (maltosyl-transferring)